MKYEYKEIDFVDYRYDEDDYREEVYHEVLEWHFMVKGVKGVTVVLSDSGSACCGCSSEPSLWMWVENPYPYPVVIRVKDGNRVVAIPEEEVGLDAEEARAMLALLKRGEIYASRY